MNATQESRPKIIGNAIQPILEFSQRHVEHFGAQYYLFACFSVVYYGAPFQIWPDQHYPLSDSGIFLKGLASTLSFILLFKEVLPAKIQKFFPVYWHFVLVFCLPFFSTYMLLKGMVPYSWTFLSLFLLSVLVDWITFVILATIGCLMGAAFAVIETKEQFVKIDSMDAAETFIVYTCASLIFIISLFLRNRDRLINERIKAYADLSGHIVHEIRKPLAVVRSGCEGWVKNSGHLILGYERALKAGLVEDKIDPLVLVALKKTPEQLRKTTSDGLLFADILLVQTGEPGANKDFVLESAQHTVTKVTKRWADGPERSATVSLNLQQDFQYFGIPILVEHVLFEMLRNSEHFFKNTQRPEIIIWFVVRASHNEIHFKDNGDGIPKDQINNIFKSGFSTRPGGTGIGLSFCNRVLVQMGGSIHVKSQLGEFTELILKFPKVRG